MRTSHFAHLDDERSVLRTLVGKIERELDYLPQSAASQLVELRNYWADLVNRLALGPAPDLRTCPTCGRPGMRTATRCGFCWAKLEPPQPSAS